jgi:predicted nucleotidyltransferase
MMNDDETLQVDFVDEVSGIRSFEGVRKRAHTMEVEGAAVRVADLADIIKMKKAADRPRDRAVLEILEKTLAAITAHQERKTGPAQEAE